MKDILTSISFFLKLAKAEGISFLLLIGIAMPLKYYFQQPEMVRIIGMIHGILFVAYCILLVILLVNKKLSFIWFVISFIASLVPFGTFWLEYQLNKIK